MGELRPLHGGNVLAVAGGSRAWYLSECARNGSTPGPLQVQDPRGDGLDELILNLSRDQGYARATGDQNTATDEYRYNNTHAKFMIVDNTWLATGSENFAYTSMPPDNKANGTKGYRGAFIITNAPNVVAYARRLFNFDFTPGKYPDLVRYPAVGTPSCASTRIDNGPAPGTSPDRGGTGDAEAAPCAVRTPALRRRRPGTPRSARWRGARARP